MEMFETILCIGLIFGPILGYIPQYGEIKRTGNTESFSTLVCLILIASNISRVFFWVLKRFELALLFQSVVMIITQLILLELIVRLNLRRKPNKSQERIYDITRGCNMSRFWNWDYFGEYLAFIITFTAMVGGLAYLNLNLLESEWITETIGFAALAIESTLAMPQLYRNYQKKSCEGLRGELVFSWFVGDAFKTVFFFTRNAPFQFVLCGIIQLSVDVCIAAQMLTYSSNTMVDSSPLGQLRSFGMDEEEATSTGLKSRQRPINEF